MRKIPTLFVRDEATRLVTPAVSPGCEWVLKGKGTATVKHDGTCCLVRGGKLYKRHETRVVKDKLPFVVYKDNWSAGDLHGNYGNQYETLLFLTKGRHKRRGYRWSNVWEFSRVPHKQLRCAAEKPVGLMRRAIEASSDPGDLVLDPFVGSGTTADAAVQCGRRAIVCDIDPKMVRVTIERLGGIPPASDEPPPMAPVCPVMQVAPPDPSLWGVHPEDLADLLSAIRGDAIPHGDAVSIEGPNGAVPTLVSG